MREDVVLNLDSELLASGAQRFKSITSTISFTVGLCWMDLDVRVKEQHKKCCGPKEPKHILKSVSGIVQPGSLLAILGSSGSGKTTLLNVLTARNLKNLEVNGKILVNGLNIGREIKNISAYIQQDDLFMSTLTVREQLKFRALLRMDKQLSRSKRFSRVEEVIYEMGLDKCADSLIGDPFGSTRSISGGERKRLSFASESLTDPPLMFCDEPTSGLDTFMAMNIVNSLQMMASKGHTVLCTIHQPSSEIFQVFDKILLMSEGNVAYLGPAGAALDFFQRLSFPCPTNFNPADHYIFTLAIKRGSVEESRSQSSKICAAFVTSEVGKQVQNDITAETLSSASSEKLRKKLISSTECRYRASYFTQLITLFRRSWTTQFRNVLLFRVRFAQALVFATVFGMIYFQLDIDQQGVMNINGAIFIIIINVTFSNIFAVINTFPNELGVFLREHGSGLYRADAYFISKTLSEVPMFFLISVVFVSVAFTMIGLAYDTEAFFWAHLVLYVTAEVAISFGYFVSAVAGSINTSLAVAPPFLIPFMLFGGLFINDEDIPFYLVWLKYVSWFRYANELLMVNMWDPIDNIVCGDDDDDDKRKINSTHMQQNQSVWSSYSLQCKFRDGQDVLKYMSFDKDDVYFDLGMLFLLMFMFRILAMVALIIRAKLSED